MVVYGHAAFRLNARRFLRGYLARLDNLPAAPRHDAFVGLLVDWGEAESAAADDLLADRDDEHEMLGRWRAGSDAIAEAVHASWTGDAAAARGAIDRCRAAVASLSEVVPDVELSARTAEGFALYALYPEQYIAAAQRFVRDRAPASVMCIGLRSIGSILAHVVAATMRQGGAVADVRSVRPRGHPFERQLAVGAGLRNVLRTHGADLFAVVDEGPGLSGSSFAAAADYLAELGVPEDRVVLFPSWNAPAEALRSPRARVVWTRHQRMTASFEQLFVESGRLFGGRDVVDISAGAWRSRVFDAPDSWPPVQPQHERRRYVTSDRQPSVFRFVGLGRRGAALHQRAGSLADAGFSPPGGPLADGFLAQPWVHGRPLTGATPAALRRIAAYIAFVRSAFVTGEPECIDDVHAMLQTNAGEALGPSSAGPVDDLGREARVFSEPRTAVDGRMLPYEWLASGDGLTKVDALDHHADDFWPGCRDIAWDVAGAIVEFDLDRAAGGFLADEYAHASGDLRIRQRLPFYEAAYLAYRIGYATLAADTLGPSPDGLAFRQLRERYCRSLDVRLEVRRRSTPRC